MNELKDFIVKNFGIEKFNIIEKALSCQEINLNTKTLVTVLDYIKDLNLTGKVTHLTFNINNGEIFSCDSWFSITAWFGSKWLTISFVQNESGILYEHTDSVDDCYIEDPSDLKNIEDINDWLKANSSAKGYHNGMKYVNF